MLISLNLVRSRAIVLISSLRHLARFVICLTRTGREIGGNGNGYPFRKQKRRGRRPAGGGRD
jgi:hypothetical protein